MSEQQQTKNTRGFNWPHEIEREDDFSGLAVLANVVAFVSFFVRRRIIVMLSVVLFALSIPGKKKVDLTLGGLVLSGFVIVFALLYCYAFNPDAFD